MIDALVVRRELKRLGIKVVSICENIDGDLEYNLRAVLAEEEKRTFQIRSAAGMDRAAREGRYCGGIVSIGYVVEGQKQHARVVPSDEIIWGDWTGADLVRKIYHWLAIEGWSCPKISRHLNSLKVPTAYGKDGRLVKQGERRERTQGVWRPGRIRNIVKNTSYKGEFEYGKRSEKTPDREVISAPGPALVSKEMWQAAQETLSRNRAVAKNTRRVYLLKSVIKCGGCGLTYIGSWGRGFGWYRCNGKLTDRGPTEGRCPAKGLRGPDIEVLVWDDIERFVRDPGDILEELSCEKEMDAGAAIVEAELMTLEGAIADLGQRRERAIDLQVRGTIPTSALEKQLEMISREEEGVQERLDEIQASRSEPDEPLNPDLLVEVRRRLDEGLNDIQRQEIVRLLVKKITVYTEVEPEGKKARVLIEYRFPAVVNTSRDMDSWPPPA